MEKKRGQFKTNVYLSATMRKILAIAKSVYKEVKTIYNNSNFE